MPGPGVALNLWMQYVISAATNDEDAQTTAELKPEMLRPYGECGEKTG